MGVGIEELQKTNEDSQKKQSSKSKEQSKKRKLIASVLGSKRNIMVVATSVIVLAILLSLILSRPPKLTTFSESSLKESFTIDELSTVEFIYNSIAEVKGTEKNKKVIKYYVAYNGTVKAGFNSKDLKVTKNEKSKKYVVEIPEMKINSTNVKSDIKFIFTKAKYEKETVYAEAYSACINDLEIKSKDNSTLLEMAKTNAISTVKALVKPWEENLPDGYKIEVR